MGAFNKYYKKLTIRDRVVPDTYFFTSKNDELIVFDEHNKCFSVDEYGKTHPIPTSNCRWFSNIYKKVFFYNKTTDDMFDVMSCVYTCESYTQVYKCADHVIFTHKELCAAHVFPVGTQEYIECIIHDQKYSMTTNKIKDNTFVIPSSFMAERQRTKTTEGIPIMFSGEYYKEIISCVPSDPYFRILLTRPPKISRWPTDAMIKCQNY